MAASDANTSAAAAVAMAVDVAVAVAVFVVVLVVVVVTLTVTVVGVSCFLQDRWLKLRLTSIKRRPQNASISRWDASKRSS